MCRNAFLVRTIFGIFIALAMGDGSASAQTFKIRTLAVTAEYEGWRLQDVSFDGRLALLYQPSRRIDAYSLPSGDTSQIGMRAVDNILSVIRIKDGHEIARRKTKFFPDRAAFFAFSHKVAYSESPDEPQGEFIEKFWDPETGTVTTCHRGKLGSDGSSLMAIVFADEKRAVALMGRSQAVGHVLLTVELPTCRVSQLGALSGSSPRAMLDDVAISPDGRQIAFGTRDGGVVVRSFSDLSIVTEIQRGHDLYLGGQPLYTRDGKYLVLVASTTIEDKEDTRRFLQFYDTNKYELVKQKDVTHFRSIDFGKQASPESKVLGTAVAMSPDGKTIAIAHTRVSKEGTSFVEQAQIVLYDIESGREVARAQHKPVQQNRNDPFASRINRLFFTSDGHYLLSGTQDTVVWKL